MSISFRAPHLYQVLPKPWEPPWHICHQILHSFSLKDLPKSSPTIECIQMPWQTSRIRAAATSQDPEGWNSVSLWLPQGPPSSPGSLRCYFTSLFLTRPWSQPFQSLASLSLSSPVPCGFSQPPPSSISTAFPEPVRSSTNLFLFQPHAGPLLAPSLCMCSSSCLEGSFLSPPVTLLLNARAL